MSATLPARLNQSRLNATMHVAWWSFVGFMILPLLLLAFVVPYVVDRPAASDGIVERWVIGTAMFLVVSAAVGMFYREQLFRPCLHGEAISPKIYLRGMITLWALLEAGILACFVSALVVRAMMPCLAPASVAYILLFSMYPGGTAMLGHGHETDDPSEYHDVR